MAYFFKSLRITFLNVVVLGVIFMTNAIATQIPIKALTSTKLRVATFNVSMEALNYVERIPNKAPQVSGKELTQALKQNSLQIRNIAEIIQRIRPDIILLNEFDRVNNKHDNIRYFIDHYLGKKQNGQESITYPYFYQGPVNTGVKINSDLNKDGIVNQQPSDTHGFGYFEGHFGMVLLSKYPIDEKAIRTFQHFKWHDMPNALMPIDPSTQRPWFSDKVWRELRLSSKSHWDVPINVNGRKIHILASHPTPPVFDGPENRNGKRNHDEIRFWKDYIHGKQSDYIYDDNGLKGGLASNKPFIILGDQNASSVEGDAINASIKALITNEKLQDPMPTSVGGKLHNENNDNAQYHTAYWGMRADYVLPSTLDFTIKNSGVFWPKKDDDTYRLIKDRAASSDHRLVWVDLELPQ